jgi:two-component system response regulator CpxR
LRTSQPAKPTPSIPFEAPSNPTEPVHRRGPRVTLTPPSGAFANQPTRPTRPNPPDCTTRPVLKPDSDSSRQNEKLRIMRPKKTILCVDNNEQCLSVRTFLLETRGYRVIALTDPHQALDVIAASLPGTLDLLLSDLIMPQMDGNELVRRAKQMHPELPAMLISGTVTAYDRAGRADAFLPKGACSSAELLERVRILVARKRGPKKYSMPVAPMMPSHSLQAAISA